MNVRATPVHVESAGAGPPLVLLHGFALHGGLFSSVLPALTRRHRVHVVDLPAHGWSAPVAPYDLPTIAAIMSCKCGALRSGWNTRRSAITASSATAAAAPAIATQ